MHVLEQIALYGGVAVLVIGVRIAYLMGGLAFLLDSVKTD